MKVFVIIAFFVTTIFAYEEGWPHVYGDDIDVFDDTIDGASTEEGRDFVMQDKRYDQMHQHDLQHGNPTVYSMPIGDLNDEDIKQDLSSGQFFDPEMFMSDDDDSSDDFDHSSLNQMVNL